MQEPEDPLNHKLDHVTLLLQIFQWLLSYLEKNQSPCNSLHYPAPYGFWLPFWFHLLKKNNLINLFIFGCAGSSFLRGFSLVVVSRGDSCFGAQALQCSSFSSCSSLDLEHQLSSLVHRFGCSMECGIFLDQDWIWVSWICRWILYHWATREALIASFTTLSLAHRIPVTLTSFLFL